MGGAADRWHSLGRRDARWIRLPVPVCQWCRQPCGAPDHTLLHGPTAGGTDRRLLGTTAGLPADVFGGGEEAHCPRERRERGRVTGINQSIGDIPVLTAGAALLGYPTAVAHVAVSGNGGPHSVEDG